MSNYWTKTKLIAGGIHTLPLYLEVRAAQKMDFVPVNHRLVKLKVKIYHLFRDTAKYSLHEHYLPTPGIKPKADPARKLAIEHLKGRAQAHFSMIKDLDKDGVNFTMNEDGTILVQGASQVTMVIDPIHHRPHGPSGAIQGLLRITQSNDPLYSTMTRYSFDSSEGSRDLLGFIHRQRKTTGLQEWADAWNNHQLADPHYEAEVVTPYTPSTQEKPNAPYVRIRAMVDIHVTPFTDFDSVITFGDPIPADKVAKLKPILDAIVALPGKLQEIKTVKAKALTPPPVVEPMATETLNLV